MKKIKNVGCFAAKIYCAAEQFVFIGQEIEFSIDFENFFDK